jgi:endoglucanase
MNARQMRHWTLGTALVAGVLANGCAASTATGAAEPAALPDGVVILGQGPSVKQDPPPPPLRVTQLGYGPAGPKYAVVVDASQQPLTWELLDTGGQVVASGQTRFVGDDADSGDRVHQIDFSAFRGEGDGFKIKVGSEVSPPFAIKSDLFGQLKSDAIWYFYQNRSGIALEMPDAGDEKWTRPAGHLSDKEVPCAPKELLFPGQIECDHSLDVTGGWYDAGDHGKYVVNGGISAWTLLNLYERMLHRSKEALADYDDGKLRLPERDNGVPDILDEARWEVEWMMKMQVPPGKQMAGMVHHKVHDERWTGMGMPPPEDVASVKITPPNQPQGTPGRPMRRYLRPVSTAATLNLAATAAQAARVYRGIDDEFAKRALDSAETAWRAAQANPKVLAPQKDTMGGGPYDDTRLEDEFYWAATELFITTGKPEYEQQMTGSPFHDRIPDGADSDGGGPKTPLTWQSVSAAGTISLATVPSKLGDAGMKAAQQEVIRHADTYLKLRDGQGYRTPFESVNGAYPWGSNSFVLNNMLAMGLAHDFTGDQKYLTGMVDGINYILGVNAMGQSYVTGYGTRPLKNPHHRTWSNELGPAFPPAPPGCVSGGPNSGLQDPVTQKAGLPGCKPQKCFIDKLGAWSVNEITINWNAPFAWVTQYLDEQAKQVSK